LLRFSFYTDNEKALKFFIFTILSCGTLPCFSQNNLKVFVEKEGDKMVFYAKNNEVCPVSILLNLELNNLTANGFGNGVFQVPGNAEKWKLVELARVRRGKTTYSYNYKAVYGDVYQTTYNGNYLYDLPYNKSSQYRIEQGYHGRFTHQDENALDFNMPEGTQIRAARGGIVVAVIQNFKEACLQEECKKMANYVLIYHSDGTFTDYSHIQYNSARVAVGDSIKKGDIIAKSGSTGYARGPHLHFVAFLSGIDKRRTITTKFRIGDGKTAAYLRESTTYRKNYN